MLIFRPAQHANQFHAFQIRRVQSLVSVSSVPQWIGSLIRVRPLAGIVVPIYHEGQHSPTFREFL